MSGQQGCSIADCDQPWYTLLPSNVMSYRTAEALCDENDIAKLCRKHYRALRSSEGFILGYRYDRTHRRMRSYIKEWIM